MRFCSWHLLRFARALSALVPLCWIGSAFFEATLGCNAILLDENCATARHIDRSVLVTVILSASSAAGVLRIGLWGDPMLVAAHFALIVCTRAMLHFTYVSGCAASHPKRDRQQIFVLKLLRIFLLIAWFLIFIIAFFYSYLLLLRVHYLHRVCCVNLQ